MSVQLRVVCLWWRPILLEQWRRSKLGSNRFDLNRFDSKDLRWWRHCCPEIGAGMLQPRVTSGLPRLLAHVV